MRKILYILGELDDIDLQWFLDIGDSEGLGSGTDLLLEGSPPDHLYVVVDGELMVRKGALELARLGPGEVVGEMSLIDRRAPGVTVTVTRDTLVFALPHDVVRARLGDDPGFAARFYRAMCVFLANRLSRTDAIIGRDTRVAGPLANQEPGDVLSPSALDGASLAGARFQWFAERVRGRSERRT